MVRLYFSQKNIFALIIIFALSLIIFSIPSIIGKQINPAMLFSASLMITIYIVLSFELLHRTSLALVGALAIVVTGIFFEVVQPVEALDVIIDLIDFNTIGLLLGMMIIVAIIGETGVFNWVGLKATRLSKGNLWKLMLILCSFTAITSMFVDNVTIILLMVPVTISICRALDISPISFILAQTLSSNIGGAATLIGDPPNIIIGSAANIDFNAFIIHMGPPSLVTFVVGLFLIKIIFRNDLQGTINISNKFRSVDEESLIRDKTLLLKSLGVLFGVIFLFSFHGFLHLEVSIIALGGSAILLTISRSHVDKILQEVDWSTLIFFAGLFVVVGVAEKSGLIETLSILTLGITGGDPWVTLHLIVWLSALASAFVDNIPFTTTMVPIIENLNLNVNMDQAFSTFQYSPLWWALAIGADLGGNGTLIGSSAGVVAAGISLKYGNKISFLKWFKVGFPFMLITVAIGSLVLTSMILLM
jgi:Na+/H+ antiporter NhaD/arsenite permease-like protein